MTLRTYVPATAPDRHRPMTALRVCTWLVVLHLDHYLVNKIINESESNELKRDTIRAGQLTTFIDSWLKLWSRKIFFTENGFSLLRLVLGSRSL